MINSIVLLLLMTKIIITWLL